MVLRVHSRVIRNVRFYQLKRRLAVQVAVVAHQILKLLQLQRLVEVKQEPVLLASLLAYGSLPGEAVNDSVAMS